MVTPSYMLNIIEEFQRQGLDPAASSLKVGIFGAEPWTDAMRGEIEQRAGIDAVDIYGLSEVMGPGVASECIESKDGPVIWEDHFYPEIIDPETGEVLPDGEEGRTGIHLADQGSAAHHPLPHARPHAPAAATSRSMRRIGKITGRSDDMLIIRGVNVFPTQIEELICKMPKLAPHLPAGRLTRRPPRQARRAGRAAPETPAQRPADRGAGARTGTPASRPMSASAPRCACCRPARHRAHG